MYLWGVTKLRVRLIRGLKRDADREGLIYVSRAGNYGPAFAAAMPVEAVYRVRDWLNADREALAADVFVAAKSGDVFLGRFRK